MLTRYVALVAEESAIPPSELATVASALQKQVTRDFSPLWKIEANVVAFTRLEDVPIDYWRVIIMDDIIRPEAAGYHQDSHGQPFALVKYIDDWTVTASHEVLEMLGDPFGRHMVAGLSPKDGQGRVNFLVEVCDPCCDDAYAYCVNGIKVSDFYTPRYFDPVVSPGTRYSYTGAITQPRQVLKGGYLTWYNPVSREWWQRSHFGAKQIDKAKKDLKVTDGNLRSAIDKHTEALKPRKPGPADADAKAEAKRSAPVFRHAAAAADNQASDLRGRIAALTREVP